MRKTKWKQKSPGLAFFNKRKEEAGSGQIKKDKTWSGVNSINSCINRGQDLSRGKIFLVIQKWIRNSAFLKFREFSEKFMRKFKGEAGTTKALVNKVRKRERSRERERERERDG